MHGATDGRIPVTARPRTRVQDVMYLATWPVLVQYILPTIALICTGTEKPGMDHLANVHKEKTKHINI